MRRVIGNLLLQLVLCRDSLLEGSACDDALAGCILLLVVNAQDKPAFGLALEVGLVCQCGKVAPYAVGVEAGPGLLLELEPFDLSGHRSKPFEQRVQIPLCHRPPRQGHADRRIRPAQRMVSASRASARSPFQARHRRRTSYATSLQPICGLLVSLLVLTNGLWLQVFFGVERHGAAFPHVSAGSPRAVRLAWAPSRPPLAAAIGPYLAACGRSPEPRTAGLGPFGLRSAGRGP